MRATTIGMPEAPTAPGLDRLTTILLLAFVGAVQLSIAAAQILLSGSGGNYGFHVEYCLVQGGDSGIGRDAGAAVWLQNVIATSPKFVSPAGPDGLPDTFADNDYRLSQSSPAIDFATTALFPDDPDARPSQPLRFDLSGAPRIHDDPGTPNLGVGFSTYHEVRGEDRHPAGCVLFATSSRLSSTHLHCDPRTASDRR